MRPIFSEKLGETMVETPFQKLLSRPEVKEFCRISRKDIGIMAIHGGGIDPGTEQIARAVAGMTDASIYIASARSLSGNGLVHVTSTRIFPDDSQNLKLFIHSVETAVSIHGHERSDFVYVGGLNEHLREKIAQSLEQSYPGWIRHEDKKIPEGLRGISPRNIVNSPKHKGVQIELPRWLRPFDKNYDLPVTREPCLKLCNAISSVLIWDQNIL